MSRNAIVFVCDDLSVSLSGKFNVSGIYTSDIIIPVAPFPINQLVFLFHIECDLTDPFKSLSVQVSFPSEAQPRQMTIPIAGPPPVQAGRSRWTLRWPFLTPAVVLTPGRIATKVIHDAGEIESGGIWTITPPTGEPAPNRPIV